MKLSNAILFLSLGLSCSARPTEKDMTTRRLRTQTVYKSSSSSTSSIRLPSQLTQGYRALQGLFGDEGTGGVPDGIPQSMITDLSLSLTFSQPGDLGPAIPMPSLTSEEESTEELLGSDYCTWGPDYNCYFAGWPMCCEFQNCPEAQPSCEIEPPPSGAGGLECPNSFDVSAWKEMELNTDAGVRFKYAIVLSESGSPEESIFCGRLESDEASQGWVAWGISPAGTMEGGEGVIGTPSDGIVQKYTLGSSPRVEPMPQEKQTLMSTSLTQEDGVTVMEFTKYLAEEGEHTINPTGENVFLYAVGMSNDLGYHGASRGSFIVTLGADEESLTSDMSMSMPPVEETAVDPTMPTSTTTTVIEEEEFDPFFGLDDEEMSMSMPEDETTEDATIPPADEEPVTMDMCTFCPDGVTVDPAFVVDPDTGATCQQISDYAPSLDASDPTCLQMSMGSFMCCPEAASDPCSFCIDGIPNEDLEIPDEDGGSTSCGMAAVFASTLESTMDMCAEMKMGEIVCCPEDDGEFEEEQDFSLPMSMPDETTPPATVDVPVPTPSPIEDLKPGWWRPTGEPTAPIPPADAGEPAGSTDSDRSGSAAMTTATSILVASIATVVGSVLV